MSTTQTAPLKPVVDIDLLCINTIRTLSIDAVQQAKSGHPGTPMALAPLVYTIWNRVMRFDPKDPIWPNRDRFVLSNGHASMLLWSVLHLTKTQAVNAEYEILGQPSVTLEDIRRFRQLDSKAAGHPEYHLVSGVETTTGPLGQGVATSVGMADRAEMACRSIQQTWIRSFRLRYLHRLRRRLHDGRRRVGSGSIAGHLELDNLCWIYDNNHITIEGNTRIAFTEDVAARFLGLRMERPAGRRCQRYRAHRACARNLPADKRPAHLDHSGQPHRLRLAAQARHAPRLTANRWARKKSA